MIINSNEALSILQILGDGAILSKTGAITLCFYLDNPACYSLSMGDFDARNNDFFRAFKHMGANTYVHKQDIFLRKGFDSSIITGNSFIQQAEKRYFDGKTYINHFCILSFTLSGLKSLESSYVKNPLSYSDNLTNYDKQRLSAFLDEVENAVTIINNIPHTQISPMEEYDVKQYLFDFVNGFYNDAGIRDNIFDHSLNIGDKRGAFFALCEADYLPEIVKSNVKDDSLPTANVSLYASLLERLGVHLKCTHVVNQMWHFTPEYKGELSHKVRIFGQHRGFDKEIERSARLLEELEHEIVNEGNIICKTHFNVYILEEEKYFDKAVDYVKGIFQINDFKFYLPVLDGLCDIYLGSIIGCLNKLNPLYWYMTDLRSSLCLMLNYSTFKQDPKGTFFNERLYNTPLRVDLWDAPQGNKLPARNGIIIASTGGGKSVTSINIVQQDIEAGLKMVVVEFGKSFYQLTQLYESISLHVDYDGTKPLGINPFQLDERVGLSDEKIKTLANIVLKFWRSKAIREDDAQVVSLRQIIKDYYTHIDDNHSFPSFYNYVKEHQDDLFTRLDIPTDYFDIKHFLHICKEFLEGGIYENVCKVSELGKQIAQKDFIVFELTKIKKDPFLVDIVMSILLDVIETKLLNRSVRGKLVFDEYAEVQTLGDSDGTSIHSTVAFAFQKLRKENSSVTIIVQSPTQLGNNEFTKGIVSNTQILYVLPTTESVYDAIIETFKIKNNSHIALMKSTKNNFQGNEKYSELFMRFGDLGATVVRLQLSPEKFLASQTDGDTWQTLQDEAQTIGLQQAIVNQINKQNNETISFISRV